MGAAKKIADQLIFRESMKIYFCTLIAFLLIP